MALSKPKGPVYAKRMRIVDLLCNEKLEEEKLKEGTKEEVIPNDFELTEQVDTSDSLGESLEWLEGLSAKDFEDVFTEEHNEITKYNEAELAKKCYNLHQEEEKFNRGKDNPVTYDFEEAMAYSKACFKYYGAELKNGFYTGWVSTWRCRLCDEVLGVHPSTYKRIYWMPEESCKYCSGQLMRREIKHVEFLRGEANKWKARCKKYLYSPYKHFQIVKT